MSNTFRLVVLCAVASVLCGCSGSSSPSSSNNSPQLGGNTAPAANAPAAPAAPMGGMGGMGGMPGMPMGDAAASTSPAETGEAAAAGPSGDMYSYMPANLKVAVGATIAPLQKKDNPLGDALLSQLRPITSLLEGIQVPVDQIDRLWAGSDRDTGDMLVCIRTRGQLKLEGISKALRITAKPEKVGKLTVFNFPDNPKFKNALGILPDLRTVLIGRRQTVEAAARNAQAGPVKLGYDAIAASRPFYWVSGDESFGQTHFDRTMFALLKTRSSDAVTLNCKGFAMGFSDAGATQSGNTAAPTTDGGAGGMPGTPMDMGGYGAFATQPMVPMNDPATNANMAAYAGGAMNPMGGTGETQVAAANVEMVVAATLESEAKVDTLESGLKELFKLADEADVTRQEAAAKAKASQPREIVIEEPNPNSPMPMPGAAGPMGMPMPGAAMPMAAMPPMAAGMPMPGMEQAGQPGQSGGKFTSTLKHPTVLKKKAQIKIVRTMNSDEKDQARTVGLLPAFSNVAGFAPVNDGVFRGTLEVVATGLTAWAASKPNEYRGALPVPGASRDSHHGWMTQLLPYLGESRKVLYDRIDFKKSPLDPRNAKYGRVVIPEFLNPGGDYTTWSGHPFDGMALTHFVGMSGLETNRNDVAAQLNRNDPRAGVFGYDQIAKPSDIKDGAAQTIMLIGSDRVAAPWILGGGATIRGARAPYFNEFTGFSSMGLAKPGTLVLFADGSSRPISADINPEVFKALCTIRGAEKVDMGGIFAADAPPAATETAAAGK